MPNVMAVQPNISGALCEIFVIPFLVPRRKVWLTPAAGVPCSNASDIGERKNWDVKWILHLTEFRQAARAPENAYTEYQPRRRPNIVKVRLAYGERRRCSNEGKTRNPLKFVGVPQTGKPISAVSRPKFTILWEHVEKILLFNRCFFPIVDTCLSCEDTRQIVRWCPMANFLAIFCVLYISEPRAAHFRPAF